MEKHELINRLKKYPDNAKIIPRNNSYLGKSWFIVKYVDDKNKEKTDGIMVE